MKKRSFGNYLVCIGIPLLAGAAAGLLIMKHTGIYGE